MRSAYFIVPKREAIFPTKYSALTDAAGRSLSERMLQAPTHSSRMTHQLVRTNEKYLAALLDKWGSPTMLSTATKMTGIPGFPFVGPLEPVYFWPNDIVESGERCISFNDIMPPEALSSIANALLKHDARCMILPSMLVDHDYSTLPEVDGMFYILPRNVGGAAALEDVCIDGLAMFKKFSRDWVDNVVAPKNNYIYLDENEQYSPIVVEGRPDILLMPYDAIDGFGPETFNKTVLYYVIGYLSAAVQENLFSRYASEEVDRVWLEKTKLAIAGVGKVNTRDGLGDAENAVKEAVDKLCLAVKSRVVWAKRASISDGSTSVDNKMLEHEIKALRAMGCIMQDNEIIYRTNNVVLEHPNGRYHLIGDLEVAVQINDLRAGARVRMQNNKKSLNTNTGHIHPHVSQSGTVCTGNVSEETSTAIARGEISRLIMFIDAVLHSFNYEGPYTDLVNWPECDKDGKLLQAKGSAATTAVVSDEEDGGEDDEIDTDEI